MDSISNPQLLALFISAVPTEPSLVGNALGAGASSPQLGLVLAFPQLGWNNPGMVIGDRLRELREQKKMSQGDVEKKTGLLRCYISRVENGHTVPAVQTLEKLARAFEVPLYKLFYDGQEPPKAPNISVRNSSDEDAWGRSRKGAEYLSKLRRLLAKANENDRKLILFTVQKMVRQ